ncbi:sugar transferase [Cellulomonas marina]|uniref:Undecaprenyl-phosphate galactose phosphotransferase, WbaP/exopolysaccharide biosynthesis polyprenyl glycosylphosphotransferase n=1 Tax=Cellulomonas marina TaxID=988821 RepID=A0A1I0X0G5_9CELL|nr:sugar transferase [Cellulomonas marina]GIG29351.1 polyprenyl glycosylphosphotransferase [Cellulomonas marina]SFA94381.1 Undecaprenyl-phosphate galactose phosphotransferase, WbaP/exopolysaccharide biosynthesis polyprenyl glycosylphosphotransferase [Cellulomonas marina]
MTIEHDVKGLQQAQGQRRREWGSTRSPEQWSTDYRVLLWISDTVAVAAAAAAGYFFHLEGATPVLSGGFAAPQAAFSAVLLVAWLTALAAGRTRDRRLIGTGPAEYTRVFAVSWRLFAAMAVVAFMGGIDMARGYLAITFPLGVLLLLVGRFARRQALHRQRAAGTAVSSVVVVGHRERAAELIDVLHHNPRAGYAVVGVCIPSGEVREDESVRGVPVLGSMADAAEVAQMLAVDAVAVTGADAITMSTVRRLGWELEGTGIDLALSPGLLDVAGPRMMLKPVNGLPLLYVDEPTFRGARYVVKSVFDWVAALLITIALSPVMLVVGLLVKFTSPGPVFYRQERIGRHGMPFGMIKFRSMYPNAHERLAEVLAAEGITETGMFYKPKNDPRITPVGKVIRKYSLDELPQLFNVLRGEMSLVGPRPQIHAEVALYDEQAARRLLVKPGLTGLWQVSGRSALEADEAIRLDVTYAENWTMFGDLAILARTAKVMVTGDGAR